MDQTCLVDRKKAPLPSLKKTTSGYHTYGVDAQKWESTVPVSHRFVSVLAEFVSFVMPLNKPPRALSLTIFHVPSATIFVFFAMNKEISSMWAFTWATTALFMHPDRYELTVSPIKEFSMKRYVHILINSIQYAE